MAESWGFVAVFLVIALSIPLIGVLAAALLRPHRPGPIKRSTYECGLGTEGDSWVQYKVQYYLYALVFVLFDVETVFVYPWAVAYNRLGLFAFVEMILFIVTVFLAYAYVWRRGGLDWD